MTPEQIGIVGCVALVVLLCSSMPVAFAMAVVGFVGFAVVVNPQAAVSMLTTDLYKTFASYSLTVIPLFVLMGQVAFHGGHQPASVRCGVPLAGPAAGRAGDGDRRRLHGVRGHLRLRARPRRPRWPLVALPEMKRYKYNMELACGAVAAGGTIGMMIPPSVVFIVYAILTEQSIGKLFIAGILPGLLTALLFCVVIYLQCMRRPELGPPAPSTSWRRSSCRCGACGRRWCCSSP